MQNGHVHAVGLAILEAFRVLGKPTKLMSNGCYQFNSQQILFRPWLLEGGRFAQVTFKCTYTRVIT